RISVESLSSIVCKQTTHFATLLPILESCGHVTEYSAPQWGQKKVPSSGRRRRTLPGGRAATPPRSVNNSRRFIGGPPTTPPSVPRCSNVLSWLLATRPA